jgi:hypothetical protein
MKKHGLTMDENAMPNKVSNTNGVPNNENTTHNDIET